LWPGGPERPKPADLGANVPVLGVRQAWAARIGSTAGLALQANVQGSAVTVASSDGTVASFNARTGKELWRTKVAEGVAAGVGSDGRWTAVVSRDNDLVVLEAGREAWRHRLPAQVFTAPLVAGERVFVLAADRSISAFDAARGTTLWSLPGTGAPLVLRQAGVLLAVGDTLVAGVSGRLGGLNPDAGSGRWGAPLAVGRGTNDGERLVERVGPVSRVQARLPGQRGLCGFGRGPRRLGPKVKRRVRHLGRRRHGGGFREQWEARGMGPPERQAVVGQ